VRPPCKKAFEAGALPCTGIALGQAEVHVAEKAGAGGGRWVVPYRHHIRSRPAGNSERYRVVAHSVGVGCFVTGGVSPFAAGVCGLSAQRASREWEERPIAYDASSA
jgi:hypothetical protein